MCAYFQNPHITSLGGKYYIQMVVLFRTQSEQKHSVLNGQGLVVSFPQPIINTQVILWPQLIPGAENLAPLAGPLQLPQGRFCLWMNLLLSLKPVGKAPIHAYGKLGFPDNFVFVQTVSLCKRQELCKMGLTKRRGIFNDLRVRTWNIFILTNIYHVMVSTVFSIVR